MDEPLLFGSREYGVYALLLLFSRGMDFLSTWIATPNLVLEANPLAKRLRWKWGILLNLVLCGLFAFWPLPAIIICTTSVLVAARNFQLAWLMRSHGEENYRDWFLERLEETPPGLFVFCLLAQTLLTAAVGGFLIYFSGSRTEPLGIGMGIIAYAVAVMVFTMIALWRNRRAALRRNGVME
jgi:hypothetical protein